MNRRWLQFSLRSFLFAVALFSACILWPLQRAATRGRAIDALEPVALVRYHDDTRTTKPDSQFWLDLKRVPIRVYVVSGFDTATAMHVVQAKPIKRLKVYFAEGEVGDAALIPLRELNDGCEMVFRAPASMSDRPFEELRRALPTGTVEVMRDSSSFWERFMP